MVVLERPTVGGRRRAPVLAAVAAAAACLAAAVIVHGGAAAVSDTLLCPLWRAAWLPAVLNARALRGLCLSPRSPFSGVPCLTAVARGRSPRS